MTMTAYDFGIPGYRTARTFTPREWLYSASASPSNSPPILLPAGRVIDGAKARDPGNGTNYTVLRPGLLMGKITASGKFANSVIGTISAAQGGNQTSMTTNAAVIAELVRRVGASGTFKLTGPNVANGTSRTMTVTYSAASGTTITNTALVTGAVSAVNQINSLVTVDSTGSGTFTITIEGITTGAITYSATAATMVSNMNTALNATFGTSAVVSSGASLAALILTFSGTGYSGRPVGLVQTTPLAASTGYTISGNGTVGTSTTSPVTTAGVTAAAADEGEFVAGSLIQPTDGSETVRGVLDSWVVTQDIDGTNLDCEMPRLVLAGFAKTSQLTNMFVPTNIVDTGILAWLKSALNNPAVGPGPFRFDDNF